MPWKTHPTLAVTGSQCLASCALTPGTVAYPLMQSSGAMPIHVILNHPMGSMEVITDYQIRDNEFIHHSAGLVRTARKLAAGQVFISGRIWDGDAG
jgi:2-methylaconitate cis-trans-isomerase PrpF